MKGYIRVDQWHSHAKTWGELADPAQHKGDAAQIDKLWAFVVPPILKDPPSCPIGSVVLRVEDDDTLTVFRTNYDSSD